MDPRRWEEVQAAFDEVILLDEGHRATRLAVLGTSDPDLRAAVESLLAADAEAEARLGALEAPFLSPVPMPDLLGLAGRTVSHFHVLEPLGAGGMGMVYRAEDTRLGRAVALKFLLPHFSFDDSAKSRFLREARSAAVLDHPNLCTIYEVGESEDGRLFLAMALYAGETLKARLERVPPLPPSDAVEIARQIAQGLSCAHAAGIVHRDLKPGNIMLLPDGTLKILDFGLAHARDQSQGGTSAGWGTAAYMAPEQVRGEAVDARTDLWALGVVLYEIVTGQRPFGKGHNVAIAHAILEEEPDPPAELRADIPTQIEYVILTLLKKEPSGRFANARAVLAALTTPASAKAQPTRRWVRRFLAGSAVAVAIAWSTLVIVRSRTAADLQLDANLVAVAPFDVLDPRLQLWHEGLVDVLSRNLDGAGSLRTVPPTVVVRSWQGRADPPSAVALGRRTGARLVMFGQLLPTGEDSVRLTATLYDVARQSQVLEIEVHDLDARIDRVTDSLTLGILRELGRTQPIGPVRLNSLGSTSLPAIRAFLRAEQFFRGGAYDSTLVYARHALEIDSNFTLALRLIPRVFWATGRGTDSLIAYWQREGAHNHGLAPRESLLVVVDSLWGATYVNPTGSLLRRFYTILEEAVRRYPEDPEFWNDRGELGFHHASAYNVPLTTTQTLESFQRAIRLDSAYASAYDHAIELALRGGAPTLARSYVRAEAAGELMPALASGARLLRMLLEPGMTQASETREMIDTVSPDALSWAWEHLKTWPDSDEEAVRLARLVAPPRDRSANFSALGWVLPLTLAYRGHLREANSALAASKYYGWRAVLLTESARVGAVSHDSAAKAFKALPSADSSDSWVRAAAGWWGMTGDSASIHAFVRQADQLARAAITPADRSYWLYEAYAARPYLALARDDTVTAIAELTSLPDSLCPHCYFEPLQLAELLAARGRLQEAAALLDRELYPPSRLEAPSRGIWMLLRGRVNERLGNREEAIAAYRFVDDLWRHADPELQRYVAEAREGLRRLVPVLSEERSGRRSSDTTSLLVLPLENLSRDADQDYLVDGMYDGITAQLSQVSSLRVLSGVSAKRYTNTKKPLREIARELDVETVLRGSVLRVGDSLRLEAQLYRFLPEERRVGEWTYVSHSLDVGTLYSELARDVAQDLGAATPSDRAIRPSYSRTMSMKAYELYLRGENALDRYTIGDTRKAIEYFHQSVNQDPGFALPYAGLAQSHVVLVLWGGAAPGDAFPTAKAAALKALQLDESLSEAHLAAATVSFQYDWDWQAAERHFDRALELNPGNSAAHDMYGYYAECMGRFDQAIKHRQRALSLDPFSPALNQFLALGYIRARRYQEAVDQLNRALQLYPDDYRTHYMLAWAYALTGNRKETLREGKRALALAPSADPVLLSAVGWAYGTVGVRSEAFRLLRQLDHLAARDHVDPFWPALVLVGVGDKEGAIRLLTRAVTSRSPDVVDLMVEPMWDPLRADGRFQELVRRMSFPIEQSPSNP